MFAVSTTLMAIAWSLAAVSGGMVCGFILGRIHTMHKLPAQFEKENEKTLKALMSLMASADQLNEDVGTHSSELSQANESLSVIKTGGANLNDIKQEMSVGIARIIAANKKLENDLVVSRFKLESQAQELDRTRKEVRTDGLCQVGNRKAFDERLMFLVSTQRRSGSSFGLMIIDVDHFKRINDTFGHTAGDEVLVSIGAVLNECIRPHDFVARLGGDEFGILLDGVTPSTADAVGKRLRESIEQYDFSVGDGSSSTVVTMSMGLAVMMAKDTGQTLYQRADEALYRSKGLGRNRLSTSVDDEEIARERAEAEIHAEITGRAPITTG